MEQQKLDPRLKEKLKKIEANLLKVQEFANKIPLFYDEIIEKMLVESYSVYISHAYKDIPIKHGILRSKYDGLLRIIPDCNKNYIGMTLTKIHINTFDLYELHEKYDLDKLASKAWFYDKKRNIFYITDEQYEDFFEALYSWWIQAKEKAEKYIKNENIRILHLNTGTIITRLK